MNETISVKLKDIRNVIKLMEQAVPDCDVFQHCASSYTRSYYRLVKKVGFAFTNGKLVKASTVAKSKK